MRGWVKKALGILMFRLVFISGPIKGRRLVIQQGDVIIGSEPDCSIPLAGAGVAPRHAVVGGRERGHYIQKLDEGAKLVVNGDEVSERKLFHGDQIDIGETRMIFQTSRSGSDGGRRRAGKMLGITMISIAGILLLQAGILIGLLVYGWIKQPVMKEPDTELHMEDTDQPDTEEEPDVLHPFRLVEPWRL